MAETTRKTLKVSDCCHGKYHQLYEKREDFPVREEFQPTELYKCDVCKQLCKVLELLVEEK